MKIQRDAESREHVWGFDLNVLVVNTFYFFVSLIVVKIITSEIFLEKA